MYTVLLNIYATDLPVGLPVPPLHGPLVHPVVEVVPGKGAVGIVLPVILTLGNPTNILYSTAL